MKSTWQRCRRHFILSKFSLQSLRLYAGWWFISALHELCMRDFKKWKTHRSHSFHFIAGPSCSSDCLSRCCSSDHTDSSVFVRLSKWQTKLYDFDHTLPPPGQSGDGSFSLLYVNDIPLWTCKRIHTFILLLSFSSWIAVNLFSDWHGLNGLRGKKGFDITKTVKRQGLFLM